MILTGIARLGRDAEVRYLADGTPVANLSLAYNYGKKDAEGKRATTWVDASLWGERAGKLVPHLTKGTQLCVVLEDVCVNLYKKGDGSPAASIKARVGSLEFAGSKSDKPAEAREPATAGADRPAPAKTGGAFDDFEDDIPF